YHEELLRELQRLVRSENIICIKNNGYDFPGVPEQTIEFVFSFGVFVHLDVELIEQYLDNLQRIVAPGANVVIQYSDKTKVMAQINDGFSDNTPEKMRKLITDRGYDIVEEDLKTLWHSSVVRFQWQR